MRLENILMRNIMNHISPGRRKINKNSMQGTEKNRRILPKQSQLITINNYNKFYPQKLPSETLSSTQLKFEKSGNEKTKMKGNLLIIDRQRKQNRKNVNPSPIINLSIKKLQNWKSNKESDEKRMNSIKTKSKEYDRGSQVSTPDNSITPGLDSSFNSDKESAPRFVFREPPPFI